MKHWIFQVSLIGLLLVGMFFVGTDVQAQDSGFEEEAIISYRADIVVNIDNSIDVTENITYKTGWSPQRGIYRNIYPYSSQKRKMEIENVSVTDEFGNPYMFTLGDTNGNFGIKIGDPDTTFEGEKTYVIRYRATNAVAQFSDLDEIYWNVTGNEWKMPIHQVQASVTLPESVQSIQSACYYGEKGSTTQCGEARTSGNVYTFEVPFSLGRQEGVTVAVGFSKNVVTPYTTSENVSNFFNVYWPWLVSMLLPLITLVLSLRSWYRKGRDARATGAIVPQYDILDNLTPMEVGGIVNEKVNADMISAEIIYLATKGYVTIRQLEDRFIGLVKSKDYELTLLKGAADLPNEFDQKLLNGLSQFSTQSDSPSPTSAEAVISVTSPFNTVKLSSLKFVFYKNTMSVVTSVLDALLNKGYYKNLGRMKIGGSRIFLIIFMALWGSGFLGTILGFFLFRDDPFPLMVGIFFSVIIYGIISHFNPAKTEKGVAAKEHFLGLKDYLQIAEKDRLTFHNAPEKKPEVFEKLLPYAMVLGVADIWAKEFEGIYTAPPSWYSDSSGSAFSAVAFSHSISNFSSFATGTMGSSPSSSSSGGSGGGGSSGGGGGGGGGGSW